MKKYKHHKYEYTHTFGNAHHAWSLVGPLGGVHFHFNAPGDINHSPIAGLEYHHNRFCSYNTDCAPDHLQCAVIKEPCWHAGTSLYATEYLLSKFLDCLKANDHQRAFAILEREADAHFSKF